MDPVKFRLDELIRELRQERAELQVFLRDDLDRTRQDARDLWAQLELEWEAMKRRSAALELLAEDASEDTHEAARRMAETLREDYRRLRASLPGAGAGKSGSPPRLRRSQSDRGARRTP